MRRFAHMLVALPVALLGTALLVGCPADPATENIPPELNIDTGTNIDYVVGEGKVRITLTASDPEGGPVTLGVVDPPARANFDLRDEWAIFDWDPIASDVTPSDQPLQVIFWAEDQLGGRTERTVTLNIRAGNGIPSFLNSPSVLHNLDSGKPVRFDVRVRDDDSQRVALVMLSAKSPDGAEFTVTGDKEGKFEWEPSEAQLEYRSHFVTFVANDGQNEPVEQKVSILLNKGGGGDDTSRPTLPEDPQDPTSCYYEDRVRHTPLGPQYGTQDYRVEARLAGDAIDKYDRLVLNYSSEDVYNRYDIQLEGAEMTEENGVFVGMIPNPLVAEGESREIYYEICAIDDDATEDDAVLCGPTSLYHSFIAYSPDDDGECQDDAFANQTFGEAWVLEDMIGWEHHRGCGTSSPDYYQLDLVAQQDGDIIFTYPFDSGVDIEMYDEDKNLLPLERSECSGFTSVLILNETDEPMTRYFRVIADNRPYQISPWIYEPRSTCVETDFEPNNTRSNSTPIGVDGDPEPVQEICGPNDIDVFGFFAYAGERITSTIEFTHADGDLDLKLFAPGDEGEIDTNGIATEAALSVTDNETIEYTAPQDGAYYVLVFGYGTSNTYTLSNLSEMPEQCMDQDQFAGNDSEANPASISFQTYSDLTLCSSTSDWFEFTAYANDFYNFSVKVTDGTLADVTLTAYDADGNAVGTATRNGDRLNLEVIVAQQQQMTLEVESTSDVTYDLTYSLVL